MPNFGSAIHGMQKTNRQVQEDPRSSDASLAQNKTVTKELGSERQGWDMSQKIHQSPPQVGNSSDAKSRSMAEAEGGDESTA